MTLLPLLLLLSTAVAMATGSSSSQAAVGVFCPEIESASICGSSSTASGFVFSDGCRRVACGSDGQPKTDDEADACRPASSFKELETCQEHAVKVYRQLWLFHQQKVQAQQQQQQQQQQLPSGESLDTGEGPYSCPSLSPSAVCRRRPGFAYSDGCSSRRCVGDGEAEGASDACPTPPEGDEEAATFCHRAERKMREKAAGARLRYECLLPEDVCRRRDRIGVEYFDGCNRCVCSGVGSAYCHRLPCHPVFATDDEFGEICLRRGAGILSNRE